MSKRTNTYLEPAHSVIRKFSDPSGKLSRGIKRVSEITGASTTRVYRWMLPKEKGGTGGLIPSNQQMKLFEYAQKAQMPVNASDFFGDARAA